MENEMSNGKFEVDVSALNLDQNTLDSIESAINKIVLEEVSSLPGFRFKPRLFGPPGHTQGIIYRPPGGWERTPTLPGGIGTMMYGVVIQEAIASGDLSKMKIVEQEAEIFLKGAEVIKGALDDLNKKLG